jgi:hypothetical protein
VSERDPVRSKKQRSRDGAIGGHDQHSEHRARSADEVPPDTTRSSAVSVASVAVVAPGIRWAAAIFPVAERNVRGTLRSLGEF